MVYRRELTEHFRWLEDSKCLDEVLDEAVIAIAMTAYEHGGDWVQTGAAWMTADGIVEKFELEPFVEKVRSERLI